MRIAIPLIILLSLVSCDQTKPPSNKKISPKKVVKTGPSEEEIRQQRIRQKISEIKTQIREIKDGILNTRVTVTTLAGKVYENAEVMDWSPLKVHLYSKNGLELISIKDLSKEEGEKIGFDHKLASNYSKMQAYLKKRKSQAAVGNQLAPKVSYDNPFVKNFKSTLVMANGKKGDGGISSKKYTLLYFSASWCPPCQKFTPSLVSSNAIFNNLNCGVVLVSGDKNDSAMFNYMKSKKMPWPAISYNSRGTANLEKYGQRYIPSLTLVDSKGNIVVQGSGSSTTMDKIASALQAR
ncbi:MAG: redoxin domain-containing protein [Lentisphaerales bacterium]|nr:redoxin domain-containing protein [Lentisphaerales bacterium]